MNILFTKASIVISVNMISQKGDFPTSLILLELKDKEGINENKINRGNLAKYPIKDNGISTKNK
tara:strand:+ start:357 stop:548 length:192 start_codon:yes stop_codon:yes gene_type:complete